MNPVTTLRQTRNVGNNTDINCDNSSLYMYFKKLGFSGFSCPVEPEIRTFLALRHIPHIEGKFKTLTFKNVGLGAGIFTANHIKLVNISLAFLCCLDTFKWQEVSEGRGENERYIHIL